MSVKLPSDWSIKKLSDVADVVSGGTPSRDIADFWFPDEIEWVTPTDITRGDSRTLDFAKEKISINGLNNSSAKLLPINTVLMTSRATLGEMKVSRVACCTNQGFKSLIPKAATDVWFLYYQMGVVPLNRRLFNKSVIHRAFEATAFYGNSNSH